MAGQLTEEQSAKKKSKSSLERKGLKKADR